MIDRVEGYKNDLWVANGKYMAGKVELKHIYSHMKEKILVWVDKNYEYFAKEILRILNNLNYLYKMT